MKDLARAALDGRRVEVAVARDRGLFAHHGDRVGNVRRPVAVDDEARVAGEHRGRIDEVREPARDVARADVPADVALEDGLVEAEAGERGRHRPARVIAHQHGTGTGLRIEARVRRRVVGPEQRGATPRRRVGARGVHGRDYTEISPRGEPGAGRLDPPRAGA